MNATTNMVKIGDDFEIPDYIDLSVLDHLPVHIHKYGNAQPANQAFHWMTYQNEGGVPGEISFARNCGKYMPDLAAYVVAYLEDKIKIKLLPNRVNVMKTHGNITPHTDEGRACCINIGVRDSDMARTHFLNGDLTAETYIVQPGSAYLVNVSHMHSVEATAPFDRLLITYGFGMSYADVFDVLKKNPGVFVCPDQLSLQL